MLKSTFKKISAIAIAGAMLAGMMAVPAGATKNVYENTTLFTYTEDFSTTTVAEDTITGTKKGSGVTYIRDYANWGGTVKVKTTETGELSIIGSSVGGQQGTNHGVGVYLEFDEPLTVSVGDKLNLSFKFKSDAGTTLCAGFLANQFVYAGNGRDDDVQQSRRDALVRITTDSRIDVGGTHDNSSGVKNIEQSNWNTVTLSLDTGAAGETQTATVEVFDKDGASLGSVTENVDANHTGEQESGDTNWYVPFDGEYDKYTTISGLVFSLPEFMDSTSFDISIDDISFKHTGLKKTGTVSEISTTLLDEDFDGLTNDYTLPYTDFEQIPGTDLLGKSYQWDSGNGKLAHVAELDGHTNVALFDRDAAEECLYIKYIPETAVDVSNGEEIVISFDVYGKDDTAISGNDGKGIEAGINGGMTEVVEDTNKDFKDEFLFGLSGSGQLLSPTEGTYNVTDSRWVTVKIHIKTKDPAQDNRSTYYYEITGEEGCMNASWTINTSKHTSDLYHIDADNSTDGEQPLTTFTEFELQKEWIKENAVWIDNLKVEIKKPIVEVRGVVDPTTFTPGTAMNIDVFANTSYKVANECKIVIAEYAENGALITANTVALTDGHNGTTAYTPTANAKTMKVFVWDMSTLAPNVNTGAPLTLTAATE